MKAAERYCETRRAATPQTGYRARYTGVRAPPAFAVSSRRYSLELRRQMGSCGFQL